MWPGLSCLSMRTQWLVYYCNCGDNIDCEVDVGGDDDDNDGDDDDRDNI